ncbi:hypothetical protein Patl1_07683 [Pistacia atlantica]|uniref:Uncharacterized protein n=1 Tax=Pistacia atlantica TaxID=434234 RepID=A0ACC1AHP9_9ROSI|nr:hypothetical protein Patl1_07683 [Pistacia atlantica]
MAQRGDLASGSLKEDDANDNEYHDLKWGEIQRLPTFKRLRSSLFDNDDENGRRVTDVTKLEALERHEFIQKLIKHIEHDNLLLLQKIRRRMDKYFFSDCIHSCMHAVSF